MAAVRIILTEMFNVIKLSPTASERQYKSLSVFELSTDWENCQILFFLLLVTCSLSDACDLLHIHVLKHQTSVIRVLNKGLECRHFSSMESRHSKC